MAKKCTHKNCNRKATIHHRNGVSGRISYRKHCATHLYNSRKIEHRAYVKTTINGFLANAYHGMNQRVQGRKTGSPHLYLGKPIMPREVFYEWAKNHPDFLKLFKRWVASDNNRKLVPSINRINSSKGYTLDNVEWMTFSQNAALAGSVRHDNRKQVKAIRELLGV